MSEMPLFERLQGQDHDGDERVFRVSEVNRAVRFTLEDNWANVLIEGELSDVRRAKGHVYFTLNDEEDPAQRWKTGLAFGFGERCLCIRRAVSSS
jgi:hypothetical protein